MSPEQRKTLARLIRHYTRAIEGPKDDDGMDAIDEARSRLEEEMDCDVPVRVGDTIYTLNEWFELEVLLPVDLTSDVEELS